MFYVFRINMYLKNVLIPKFDSILYQRLIIWNRLTCNELRGLIPISNLIRAIVPNRFSFLCRQAAYKLIQNTFHNFF
jgi:hypothetical protein